MKVSNFILQEIIGNSYTSYKFRATIDVTTGFFKKKTETVEIFKRYAGHWHFVDSGKFCPDLATDNLCRAYEAKHGNDLEKCPVESELK